MNNQILQSNSVAAETVGESQFSLGQSAGKFIANMGCGGIRGMVFIVNTLVLTPILLFGLGKEMFAVLTLATPFLRYGFNGVFDFGLATGLVRFVSRDFVAGAQPSINRYMTSAMLIYLVSGLLLLTAYWLVSPILVTSLVGGDGRLYSEAHAALSCLLWIYLVLMLSNPFFALLIGIQKTHLSHLIGTASLLVELFGILIFVPFGLTISRVVLVYASGAVLTTLLCVLLSRHYFPNLKLRFEDISQNTVLSLIEYTAKWSVTVCTSLLAPVIDKVILAHFVGLPYVAIYEAAARLVEILRRITQLILLPLFPLAGAIVPGQSFEQTRGVYRGAFTANLAVSAGLYLIPATLSFGFFGIWLGSEMSRLAGLAFILLSTTALLLSLVYPAVLILAATGRMRLLVTAGLAGLFLNLFLSPVLAKYFGFQGLLAGTFLAYGGQSVLILTGLQREREFALNMSSFVRAGIVAVFGAILPGLLLGALLSQEPTITGMALFGVLAVATYSLLLLTIKENRQTAVAIGRHSKRIFLTWLAARRMGQAFWA